MQVSLLCFKVRQVREKLADQVQKRLFVRGRTGSDDNSEFNIATSSTPLTWEADSVKCAKTAHQRRLSCSCKPKFRLSSTTTTRERQKITDL